MVYSIIISIKVDNINILSHNNKQRKNNFFFFFYSYLHSCEEPIIHGNLTCDTIFIQNTGLLKIGSSKFNYLKKIFLCIKKRLKHN